MTEPDITTDPIAASLDREDEYWRQEGRDERHTSGVGFAERWELMIQEMENYER